MLRRLLVVGGVLALMVPSAALAQGKPAEGCGPGFDLGPMSYGEFIGLPREQAGIEAGVFTEESLTTALATIDVNDNQMVCVQFSNGYQTRSSSGPDGKAYYYNVVDDQSSKRS